MFRASLFSLSSLCFLVPLLGGLSGCTRTSSASGEPLIGITREGLGDEHDSDEEEGQIAPEEERPDSSSESAEDAPSREEELARAHLRSLPNNELGLAVALIDRSSDLPWIFAIENRSQSPIQLAADPQLLRFEISPPAASSTDSKPPASSQVVSCGASKLPSTRADDTLLVLAPQQVLTYRFDPRTYCDKPEKLEAGAQIQLTYGWPHETKKVWTQGKMTEVEQEPRAPYVAQLLTDGPENTESPAALKHLLPAPWTLAETYPLQNVQAARTPALATAGANTTMGDSSQVEGDATSPSSPTDKQTSSTAASAEGAHTNSAPPPPLRVQLQSPGTVSNPQNTTITVSLRNTSEQSVRLFLRRESFVYEIIGPAGSASCVMQPQDRAPDASYYELLGKGSSRSFVTRLAEACPPGIFQAPGTYSIHARFESKQSGQEYGYEAFVGQVRTEQPARLVLAGKGAKEPAAGFQLSSAPRASEASATAH